VGVDATSAVELRNDIERESDVVADNDDGGDDDDNGDDDSADTNEDGGDICGGDCKGLETRGGAEDGRKIEVGNDDGADEGGDDVEEEEEEEECVETICDTTRTGKDVVVTGGDDDASVGELEFGNISDTFGEATATLGEATATLGKVAASFAEGVPERGAVCRVTGACRCARASDSASLSVTVARRSSVCANRSATI
jgi:hypothetical protein